MLEAEMPVLLEHIHNALDNDFVTFEIALNQGVSSPSTWSEREIVAYMSESYPNMKKFMKELKLSLT